MVKKSAGRGTRSRVPDETLRDKRLCGRGQVCWYLGCSAMANVVQRLKRVVELAFAPGELGRAHLDTNAAEAPHIDRGTVAPVDNLWSSPERGVRIRQAAIAVSALHAKDNHLGALLMTDEQNVFAEPKSAILMVPLVWMSTESRVHWMLFWCPYRSET